MRAFRILPGARGLSLAALCLHLGAPAAPPSLTEPLAQPAAMESTPAALAPKAFETADENRPDAVNQSFSYYTVSGATLRGRSSSVGVAYASLGCSYVNAGTDRILNTEAPLPDGARIKYLRIYYHDTNPADGVRAFLTRYEPGAAASDLTSAGSTAAFVGGYGTSLSPEIDEIVDGDRYAYTLIGWPDALGSANRICGMRIAYYGPQFFADGFETPAP
ncbi:MAG: hypothetical protein IT479_08675 [Xanthomonadales bacterium]|nr:hypothetical protein [Xanthomonadales bacterium]MCC6593336.1 hypothetical protein [Xanthomonadales bacterium]MCE7930427.1 hypothetical protein [Xanthomonadales bacterium PRO6]